jgi:protein-S-isoprenylcysteine O-methyltransferase Ste14
MIPDYLTYPWIATAVIWLLGAFTSKRTLLRQSGSYRWLELVAVVLSFSLLFNHRFSFGLLGARFLPKFPTLSWIGLAIDALGCGFAICARFWIGRNWSSDITLKEDHELMRSGPYGIVRHPIYSGLSLAILGTAIAIGEVRGLVALALAVAAWRHKANQEERLMVEQFGTAYASYRREVKGLIPFVW